MAFDRTKFIADIQTAVKKSLESSALDLQSTIRGELNKKASNIGSGAMPSSPGEPPANNTGTLSRSIVVVDATESPFKPKFQVGTNLIYAGIQEYGGRISAKKGKFLAIPVGIDGRRAARDCGGDIRKLKLRLLRTKSGKLLLVKDLSKGGKAAKGSKAAKGDQIVILFVLKKSVILPPRPYMRPAYAAKKDAIRLNVASAIADVLKRGAA